MKALQNDHFWPLASVRMRRTMPAAQKPVMGTRVDPDFERLFRLAADAEGQTVSAAMRLAMTAYIEQAGKPKEHARA